MKFFKKSDLLVISVILAVGIIIWILYQFIYTDKAPIAEIYYYSELVETVSLDKGTDRKFSISQEPNVVFHLDREGRICFEESDCPDKVCINTGKLNKTGQFAACLPNGIVLKIVSQEKNNDDVDIVVGN